MVIVDGAQRVRWANQQAANLWAGGLAILMPGMRPPDFLHLKTKADDDEIDTSHPGHPLNKIKQGSGEQRFLVRNSRADEPQDWKPYRISWQSVEEVPGGYTLLTLHDIEPSEKALEAQQFFLNQLAHELCTPLAIITGSLKRLERETLPPKALQQTEVMRQEAHRISRLLEQMSVLSQLDTGSYPWHFETRSLASFLLEWSQQLSPTVRSHISLNLDCLDPGLQVCLDQSALIRVLDHLLDNSLLYGEGPGPILLSAKASEQEIEVRFMDWGPGIPESEHDTIFDRFKKLEHLRTASKCDGAGLGLAVVKELMEGMQGRVHLLTNRGFDGTQHAGTVIQMQVPIAKAPAADAESADGAAGTEQPQQHPRVQNDQPHQQRG